MNNPDPLIAEIVQVAREKWPEAKAINIECHLSVLVQKELPNCVHHIAHHRFARTLPELLAKLKETQ